MAEFARNDLPKHHPQNVPLSKWTDGWLTLSVSGHVGARYMLSHDHEKKANGWPVSKDEKVAFLVEKGDIPAAGV